MFDDGAVAVVESISTPPTILGHGPFIALPADNPRLPRGSSRLGFVLTPVLAALRSSLAVASGLSPAEFVQPLVIDAEVMGDLVDDRDRDFVDHLGLGLAEVQKGRAIDGDRVG